MTLLDRMFGRHRILDDFTMEQLDAFEALMCRAIAETFSTTQQLTWYLERIRIQKERLVRLAKQAQR